MIFDENGKLKINTFKENVSLYLKKYKEYFGLVDIAPASALGSDIAITAEMKKISDENLQNAFLQQSPHTATCEQLDALAFLSGIVRKENVHSLVLLTFTGADGITVPANTEVKNSLTEEIFITEITGTIENGSFSVYATAKNAGRIVCDAETVTVTELADVTVTNPTAGTVGYAIESDAQLRARIFDYKNSLNVEEQLRKELLNLNGVSYCNVLSNSLLVTDSNGLPAKTTSLILIGGEPAEIAKTIFKFISADKLLIGDIEKTVKSAYSEKEYIIKFSRPKIKNITVTVAITGSITDLVKLQIEDSILNFFSATYKVGNMVIQDRLFIPAQQNFNDNLSFFKGVENVEVLLNDSTDNIDVNYNELPILSKSNLSVVVA